MKKLIALCILSLGVSSPAFADHHLVIDDAWAAPSIPGSTVGVAYFTAQNKGDDEAKIVSAKSDVAETVELHTHTMMGDIMKMRKIDTIDIPSGHTVKAEPGGLHLMLIGLTQELAEGETFDILLTLESGKEVTLKTKVKSQHKHSHHTHEEHDGHTHHSH